MRLALRLLLLIVLAAAGAAIAGWVVAHGPLRVKDGAALVTVPSGTGLRAIADRVEAAGVDIPAWQLALLGRIREVHRRVHAGTYRVTDGTTPWQLLDMLARGDVVTVRVTLVEGLTLRELRAQLDARDDLAHDSRGLDEAALAAALGTTPPLEGRLLPETYVVGLGASDLEVLRAAHAALNAVLADAWAGRDPRLAVETPAQLLVLASIVEKETGRAEDRPRIAGVFANRLRIGMPLQSDPTVIYGMGQRFDGNLRRVDLESDTPWNTYTRGGLPPTPIAMPGRASLLAVANPPAGDDLYFVARGDGTSEFSPSLQAHNRAVNKFQRGGKGG